MAQSFYNEIFGAVKVTIQLGSSRPQPHCIYILMSRTSNLKWPVHRPRAIFFISISQAQ